MNIQKWHIYLYTSMWSYSILSKVIMFHLIFQFVWKYMNAISSHHSSPPASRIVTKKPHHTSFQSIPWFTAINPPYLPSPSYSIPNNDINAQLNSNEHHPLPPIASNLIVSCHRIPIQSLKSSSTSQLDSSDLKWPSLVLKLEINSSYEDAKKYQKRTPCFTSYFQFPKKACPIRFPDS